MSKEKYVQPEISVITFQTADIITTSAEPMDGEWMPIEMEPYVW